MADLKIDDRTRLALAGSAALKLPPAPGSIEFGERIQKAKASLAATVEGASGLVPAEKKTLLRLESSILEGDVRPLEEFMKATMGASPAHEADPAPNKSHKRIVAQLKADLEPLGLDLSELEVGVGNTVTRRYLSILSKSAGGVMVELEASGKSVRSSATIQGRDRPPAVAMKSLSRQVLEEIEHPDLSRILERSPIYAAWKEAFPNRTQMHESVILQTVLDSLADKSPFSVALPDGTTLVRSAEDAAKANNAVVLRRKDEKIPATLARKKDGKLEIRSLRGDTVYQVDLDERVLALSGGKVTVWAMDTDGVFRAGFDNRTRRMSEPVVRQQREMEGKDDGYHLIYESSNGMVFDQPERDDDRIAFSVTGATGTVWRLKTDRSLEVSEPGKKPMAYASSAAKVTTLNDDATQYDFPSGFSLTVEKDGKFYVSVPTPSGGRDHLWRKGEILYYSTGKHPHYAFGTEPEGVKAEKAP